MTPGSDAEQALTQAQLTAAIRYGAPHLRPIYEAVRDRGCAYGIVAQGRARFDLPKVSRPFIAIIGDDLEEALGPGGFHRKSLRRLVAASRAAIIVASAPNAGVYGLAAMRAQNRRENVILIETRPGREAEWLDFLQAERPGLPTIVSTPDRARVDLWKARPMGGLQ